MSEEAGPSHSTPDPLPPKSDRVIGFQGAIFFDVEGPVAYKHLPFLLERALLKILGEMVTAGILTPASASHFLAPAREAMIKCTPYADKPREAMLQRVTGVASVKFLTSVSLSVGYAAHKSFCWSYSEETVKRVQYPVIVYASVELRCSAVEMKDRDRLRSAGFISVPIPTTHQILKVKRAVQKALASPLSVVPSSPDSD